MNSLRISVLPHFWRDWKHVCKKHRSKEFYSIYSAEEFDLCVDETKFESIGILNAIKNSIINSIDERYLDSQSPQYDRQPFLSQGWTVHKKRWATDTSGKSGGLRCIFCLNSNHLLFVFIATKADCANERLLEKVFMKRMQEYLSI